MSLILKGINLPQEEINLTITKDGIHPVIVDGEYMVRVDDLDELPTILEAEWLEE